MQQLSRGTAAPGDNILECAPITANTDGQDNITYTLKQSDSDPSNYFMALGAIGGHDTLGIYGISISSTTPAIYLLNDDSSGQPLNPFTCKISAFHDIDAMDIASYLVGGSTNNEPIQANSKPDNGGGTWDTNS
jgi:hypothetical protein